MARAKKSQNPQTPQDFGYARARRGRPPNNTVTMRSVFGGAFFVPIQDADARQKEGWIDVTQRQRDRMEMLEKRRRTRRGFELVHPDRLAPKSVVGFLASLPKQDYDALLSEVLTKRQTLAQAKVEELQEQLRQAMVEAKGL